MGDTDDSGSLFNNIIGDMKAMGPLWEDLLVKASKFYGAVKQTAVTADAFLDAFQKIADVTTNSKGATRDIGVSFTKIVMRHRSIENKLKTYVGILADSFVTPLQDCIDEWKKNCNQLEKDHAKDYKRLKGDLKRASSDAAKLKKKASKKIGKQEYTDQFRDAMKVANHLCKALEEQEKAYLRKIMVEERTRAAQFFKFYRPCVEQEITMISEIEQLQSIVEETVSQCSTPSQLPIMSEDAIEAYKVPENLTPNSRDSSTSSSPPGSPVIPKDRSLTINSSSQKPPLNRSQTLPNAYCKTGLDPIPVSVPTAPNMTMSPSASSRSSYSSSSSLDQPQSMPMYDAATLNEIQRQQQQQVTPTPPNETFDYSNNSHDMTSIHKGLKTRSSWSSIETSDSSSGIGSYNSLTNKSYASNSYISHQNSYHSENESDAIEQDYLSGCDIANYPPPPACAMNGNNQFDVGYQDLGGFHQMPNNQMKYATIDRSHFRRNQMHSYSLRETSDTLKQRSNSLGEDTDSFPEFPDYKMNLPKTKTHTIAGRMNGTATTHVKPPVFQVFEGHDPATLRKHLSPTLSPYKGAPPNAPVRRNSSPSGPQTAPKPKAGKNRAYSIQEPRPFTFDNEPEEATPGSFQAALQNRRQQMKKRSLSVGHSSQYPHLSNTVL